MLYLHWPTVSLAAVSAISIIVPLVAASIGALGGAAVSRHLRRQELYVEAAQKINGYIDEAAEALTAIIPSNDFDHEQVGVAKRAVNLALFHSRRLESIEISNRLEVANFILWDMLMYEDGRGRFWAFQAIDDAMDALVQFMILPRLWPPRRSLRKLPPSRFPNFDLYRELVEPDPDSERLKWGNLRKWVRDREAQLRTEKTA